MRTPPPHRWPAIALEALRLLIDSRARLGGRYWAWRRETAFGPVPDHPSRWARLGAIIEFLDWAARMRR